MWTLYRSPAWLAWCRVPVHLVAETGPWRSIRTSWFRDNGGFVYFLSDLAPHRPVWLPGYEVASRRVRGCLFRGNNIIYLIIGPE